MMIRKDPTIWSQVKNAYINNDIDTSKKFWTYPLFKPGQPGFGAVGPNGDIGLTAEGLMSEDDDDGFFSHISESTPYPIANDENVSENDRHVIRQIVKNFPDPYDFIIGFTCTTASDNKRTGSNVSTSGVAAHSAIKYAVSPMKENLGGSTIGATTSNQKTKARSPHDFSQYTNPPSVS